MENKKPNERWKALVLQLKQTAKEKGINQNEIAQKLNMPQGNVARFFSHQFRPGLELFINIANVVGKEIKLEDIENFKH